MTTTQSRVQTMIKEKFDLSKKTALVVGGRGYLGSRFCVALAELGASVCAADLPDLSCAAKADASRGDDTPGISHYNVDVTDPSSVDDLINAIVTKHGGLDIFVCSVTAKPADFYSPFTECSLEGWQTVFRVEMDGLFTLLQRVGRVMESDQKGSIVLLSSIYGIVGNDQRIYEGSNLADIYTDTQDKEAPQKQIYSHAAYPAVKGGVLALTRYLAAYWEGQNIRVNCISPGGVAHPGENQEFVQRYSQKVPLGRKSDVDEICGAVVYLASPAASYVNGHNLVVDGGWTAW